LAGHTITAPIERTAVIAPTTHSLKDLVSSSLSVATNDLRYCQSISTARSHKRARTAYQLRPPDSCLGHLHIVQCSIVFGSRLIGHTTSCRIPLGEIQLTTEPALGSPISNMLQHPEFTSSIAIIQVILYIWLCTKRCHPHSTTIPV
jgi:hypothetical protein